MSSKPFKMPGCIFITLHSLKTFVSGFGTTFTFLLQCTFSSQLFLIQCTFSPHVPTNKTNRSAKACFEHKKGKNCWNILSENAAACNPHYLCFQRTLGLLLKEHENPTGDGPYRVSEIQGMSLNIRIEMI